MGFHRGIKMIKIVMWFELFFLHSYARDTSFDETFKLTWGMDHAKFMNHGSGVQLSLDKHSGAGFGSKVYYGSGQFQMAIKLPSGDSAGVVTAFYLNTTAAVVHDELDFEFLGSRGRKPIILQTNVFTNGVGGREQKIRLWFDPTTHFHTYKVLWNQHQIVFFVDDIPIRVFKNTSGVQFPHNAMQVDVSLWDGSAWASGGDKTNYTYAPFRSQFQDFRMDGCQSSPKNLNQNCYSSKYHWNTKKLWKLGKRQIQAYENVKRKYMTYDYCTDRSRYQVPPPECMP